jgi:hypothetical protein
MKYYKTLDAIRAIAVFLVILSHWLPFKWFSDNSQSSKRKGISRKQYKNQVCTSKKLHNQKIPKDISNLLSFDYHSGCICKVYLHQY